MDAEQRAAYEHRLQRFHNDLAQLDAQARTIDRVAPIIAGASLPTVFIHWAVPLAGLFLAGLLWGVTRYIRYTHVLEVEQRIADTQKILSE